MSNGKGSDTSGGRRARNTGNSGKRTGNTSKGSNRRINKEEALQIQLEAQEHSELMTELLIWGVLIVSIILLLCVFNLCGPLSNVFGAFLFGLFGFTAYIFPLLLFFSICFYRMNSNNKRVVRRVICSWVLYINISALIQLFTSDQPDKLLSCYTYGYRYHAGGGLAGACVSKGLTAVIGPLATGILLFITAIMLIAFITGKMIASFVVEKSATKYNDYVSDIREQRRIKQEHREDIINYDEYISDDNENRDEDGAEAASVVPKKRFSYKFPDNRPKKKTEPAVGGNNIVVNDNNTEKKNIGQDKQRREDADETLTPGPAADNTAGAVDVQEDIPVYEKEIKEKFGSEHIGNDNSLEQLVARALENDRVQYTEFDPYVEDFSGDMPAGDEAAEDDAMEEKDPVISEDYDIMPSDDYIYHGHDIFEQDIDGRNYDNGYHDEDDYDNDYDNVSDNNSADYNNEQNNEYMTEKTPVSENEDEPVPVASMVDDIIPAVSAVASINGNSNDNGNSSSNSNSYNNGNSSNNGNGNNNSNSSSNSHGNNNGNIHSNSNGSNNSSNINSNNNNTAADNNTDSAVSIDMPPEPIPYTFPPLDLLEKPSGAGRGMSERELKDTARKLQDCLKSFKVDVKMTDIICGPTVTRYELQPSLGTRVKKITELENDIKLNLAASDIRIEAPIPGKSAVGIEVPNPDTVTISLREMLETKEFRTHKSNVAFGVGKDIGGHNIVADIAKMPHMLIAGSTGSGKSVCINTIVMSLLYKADPNDVKLIMVDPKVVELSIYNGIPHLCIPVVTDPKKAAAALNWAVAEMEERYNKFAKLGARNINGYNDIIDSLRENPDMYVKMPHIIIIVDELADLMMVASHDVETAICRLAQKARAAGLHLILATQRPSVDVITGLIKNNVPSRIAFAVSSAIDSRTILDSAGAEKLLGKGDMLFYPQGLPKPIRVQGAFVSDAEVARVTDYIKGQYDSPVYDQSINEKITSAGMEGGNNTAGPDEAASNPNGWDEKFEEAGRFIIEKQKASIGTLQRVFKIGFNRGARIMDQLCEAGVVGEEDGKKPRNILMTMEEFERLLQEGR